MNKTSRDSAITIFLFILMAIILTWPCSAFLNSKLYALSGDPFGKIWWIWWQKYIYLNHFSGNYTNLLGAPHSITIYNFALSISDYAAKYLAIIFSEISAYNIVILLEIFLAGFTMHQLVLYLTKNKLAAFFSGLILMLSPYLMAQSLQHLDLAGVFWFPLIILYLIRLEKEITFKNILLSSLFIAGAISQSFYYGYMAAVIIIVYIIYFIIIKICNKENVVKFIGSIVLIGLLGLVISLPVTYKSFYQFFGPTSDSIKNIQQRYPHELEVYSAQWFNYFYPTPDNPIFGKFTQQIYNNSIEKSGSNLTEQSLYLGWTPILLMAYCLWIIAVRKRHTVCDMRVAIFFALLALTGLYFSFAPTINIFGHEFKTPAYYIFNHLPYFRVYARFGLIVNLAVAVLSGIGLSYFLSIVKNNKIARLLYCSITLLLLLEFANFPPFHYTNVSQSTMPQIYNILKELPKGVVVEYPLLPADDPESYEYLVWQRYHQFPLVYGSVINSKDDDFRKTILNPQDVITIDKLSQTNVRYLILHSDKYNIKNAKKYPQEYNNGGIPTINSNKARLIFESNNDKIYLIN